MGIISCFDHHELSHDHSVCHVIIMHLSSGYVIM